MLAITQMDSFYDGVIAIARSDRRTPIMSRPGILMWHPLSYIADTVINLADGIVLKDRRDDPSLLWAIKHFNWRTCDDFSNSKIL